MRDRICVCRYGVLSCHRDGRAVGWLGMAIVSHVFGFVRHAENLTQNQSRSPRDMIPIRKDDMREEIRDSFEFGPIKRGNISVRVDPEALEYTLNTSQAIRLTFGHNPLMPPFGKIEEQKLDKSTSEIVHLAYIPEDTPEYFVHELSRIECVQENYSDVPLSWVVDEPATDSAFVIDIAHIDGNWENFTDQGIPVQFHDRREELPIALLRYVSDLTLVEILYLAAKAALLHSAVTGQWSKWAETSAKWISERAIPALTEWQKNRTEKSKEHSEFLYEIAFDGRATDSQRPLIRLIMVQETKSTELPANAILSFPKVIANFADLLNDSAEMVFLYDPVTDKVQFQYALTKNGGVISRRACYDEMNEFRSQHIQSALAGTSIWWTLVMRDDGKLFQSLYKVGSGAPAPLGYLEIPDGDIASSLLERFTPNDGILRPIHIHLTDTDYEPKPSDTP